jgi:hypothetical protein
MKALRGVFVASGVDEVAEFIGGSLGCFARPER